VQLGNERLVWHPVTWTCGAESDGDTQHLDVLGICLEGPRTPS
jgi:hypothetical protein